MASDRSVPAYRQGLLLAAFLTGVLSLAASVEAADLGDSQMPFETGLPALRYFPRGDGSETDISPYRLKRRAGHCRLRQVPVPTNAATDPSYVGSEYGLGKPSYYGFTPPRGVDDPFGRPLLPYCR